MYANEMHLKFGTLPLFTVADIVLKIPVLRRMLVAWGATPVSYNAMKKNLSLPYPQNVLTVQVGGISEMFYGIHHEQIILKRRFGFCKLALETGASLIPAYALGQNHCWTRYWDQNSFFAWLSSKLQTSLVIWTGRWGIPFGFVPHRQKCVMALGKPIPVEKVLNPSREQIAALHAVYTEALVGLFDRHKARIPGWEDKTLYFEDSLIPGEIDIHDPKNTTAGKARAKKAD